MENQTAWERLYYLVDSHQPLSSIIAIIIFGVLLLMLSDSKERKNNRKN